MVLIQKGIQVFRIAALLGDVVMELPRRWRQRLSLAGVHMQWARASLGHFLLTRCFGVSLLHVSVDVMDDLLSTDLAADLALKADVLVCAGIKSLDSSVLEFALCYAISVM